MTSAINPNNINGAYPVAGQDNNSQGFRDNFTNTKTNFQYAKDEISDLQSKAVLKAALIGTTLNNNMGGSVLSNAQLQDMSQTVVSLPPQTGTVNIDYSLGSYQTVTATGPITLNFLNLGTVGPARTWTVQITFTTGPYPVTLPASVTVNNAGIQGLNLSTNTITFAVTGTYSFTFTTTGGQIGTQISVTEENKRLQPFNASFDQTLTANGVASLANTVTSFSTTAETIATLPNGVQGQIKVLVAANVAAGRNGVASVVSPGWKTSGTGNVRLIQRGDSATLMFINDKWFCIGNNGATFE
jgi:hypothetical protein